MPEEAAVQRPKTIVLVVSLDTKGEEALFLRTLIERRGHRVLVVDTSARGEPAFPAEVTREQVAAAAGANPAALSASDDRGRAVAAMQAGTVVVVRQLWDKGELDGALAIGGGSGTALGSAALRALPFGVPKLMVSTKASGDVAPYVGTKDIAMLHTVTDIMGLNPILRRVLANAAGAISGMVEMEAETAEGAERRAAVAVTAFGVTTTAAMRCRQLLAEGGFESLVFHANGTGGRAMEEMAAEGAFAAVLDLTTTESARRALRRQTERRASPPGGSGGAGPAAGGGARRDGHGELRPAGNGPRLVRGPPVLPP